MQHISCQTMASTMQTLQGKCKEHSKDAIKDGKEDGTHALLPLQQHANNLYQV